MKLQTKIVSTVIMISFLVNTIFQFNIIRIQKIKSEKDLIQKCNRKNELLDKVNSGPLFYYDTDLIKTNIKSFLKDPEIKSIHIKETSGEIDLYFENKHVSTNDILKIDTDILYEDQKIGMITTIYSKDIRNSEIKSALNNAILSVILASLLMTMLVLLMIRKIIQPIKDLTQLSQEISNGNLQKDIQIDSNDEIGQLAKSFIKMRDSIKEKIESLYIENEERKKIEIDLTTRTKELADANIELKAHRNKLEDLVSIRTSELQDSINNLNKTQNQLVESEKMASLGDLVAGVAHEINTPVGIGVTAASHLEQESKRFYDLYKKGDLSKSKFESFIELVNESSKMILSNMIRAARLIQSFKKVAVDQSSDEKRTFNVAEYIQEVLLSINSKFKHTKHTVNVICVEDIMLNSYPGVFSQIITNLCLNSLQHGFEGIEEGTISIEIKHAKGKVFILFSDNGVGISPDVLKRIFDPFFTTKRGQGGSGLGMNIVYNLVKQTLKGTITCASTLGKGVSFIITIPLEV